MTKNEFMEAYILARAAAVSGSISSNMLVTSAANVWKELQYEIGAVSRPVSDWSQATEEQCRECAASYENAAAFFSGSNAAYARCIEMGWLDNLTYAGQADTGDAVTVPSDESEEDL